MYAFLNHITTNAPVVQRGQSGKGEFLSRKLGRGGRSLFPFKLALWVPSIGVLLLLPLDLNPSASAEAITLPLPGLTSILSRSDDESQT